MAARERVLRIDVPKRPAEQRPVVLQDGRIVGTATTGTDRPLVLLDRARQRLVWPTFDDAPVDELRLPALPDPPPRSWDECWSVSADRRHVALLTRAELLIAEAGRWRHRIPFGPWPGPKPVGSNVLIQNDEAILVVPRDVTVTRFGGFVESVDLVAVGLSSGAIRARTALCEGAPEGSHLVGAPTGDGFLVSVGFGQDGSAIWGGRRSGDGFELRMSPEEDGAVTDVAPSGREFVTVPHDPAGDVCVFDWDSLLPVGRLRAEELFAWDDGYPGDTDDGFDDDGWYLDDEHLLIPTRQGRLLVVTREGLRVDYEVGLEGFDIVGYGVDGGRTDDPQEIVDLERDLRDVIVLRRDRLLIVHTTGRAELCVLPR